MRKVHPDQSREGLLSRDDFRTRVLGRRAGRCCVPECTEEAVDAHHIIERRLWIAPEEKGGYFMGNGAAVCERHHLDAERTVLEPDVLREWCGIDIALVPQDHYLDADFTYTKWGDVAYPDGSRTPGPLFYDESVQKVLRTAPGVLDLYRTRVKYPRTFHLPWSPGVGKDDKVLGSLRHWEGEEIVVTGKEDGENTTVYPDGYVHARSVDSGSHPSRSRLFAQAQQWAFDIPFGWRVVGENLTAVHSIGYRALPAYFLVHSIWEQDRCLSWDETCEWAELLGLKTVEVLWRGTWGPDMEATLASAWRPRDGESETEGYVARPASAYAIRDHSRVVGKFVRSEHVSSAQHWRHRPYRENSLLGTG